MDPQSGFSHSEATVSLVERTLMEADRLKMCMMWPREHETCSPTDAVFSATRETVGQSNDERFYVSTYFPSPLQIIS